MFVDSQMLGNCRDEAGRWCRGESRHVQLLAIHEAHCEGQFGVGFWLCFPAFALCHARLDSLLQQSLCLPFIH